MVTLRGRNRQTAGAETYEMKFCPYCGERIYEKLTEKQVMAKERKVKD